MNTRALIIFLRNPELGKIKTRLAKDLGDDMTYQLYLNFLRDLADTTRELDVDKIISCADTPGREMYDIFSDVSYSCQQGSTLGERMFRAFEEAFSQGYGRVALAGSDCPGITNDLLHDSFTYLDASDCCLGPSVDGGYYLIALKKSALKKKLFEKMVWSTSTVLLETIHRAEKCGLHVSLLEKCEDIDDLASLRRFWERRAEAEHATHTLGYLAKHRGAIYEEV